MHLDSRNSTAPTLVCLSSAHGDSGLNLGTADEGLREAGGREFKRQKEREGGRRGDEGKVSVIPSSETVSVQYIMLLPPETPYLQASVKPDQHGKVTLVVCLVSFSDSHPPFSSSSLPPELLLQENIHMLSYLQAFFFWGTEA